MNKHKTFACLITISVAAMSGIKLNEGYSSKPIIPTKGDVPTIGYGTTVYPNGKSVKMSDPTISKETANTYIQDHVSKIEKEFKNAIPNVKMTQKEYDTYLDFVYQYGMRTFNQSSMKIALLKGNNIQACQALLKYKYVAGRDCSIRQNQCYGVFTRQKVRYETCMAENRPI